MGFIILSLILTLGAFVGLGITNVTKTKTIRGMEDTYTEKGWKLNKKQIISVAFLLLFIPAFITKVPANSVGIKYSPFSGTSEETLSEGFHAKSPFDKVYKISTEVQTLTVDQMTSQTLDSQFVTSTLDIKYRVNANNAYLIFKQYRELDKMSSSLIMPTTQRILELVTTKYNVMDILGESRANIYGELETNLTNELAKYGVEFYSISITDMDAGDEIEAAITAQAVAKKAVETAEQELLKAQTDAKQKSVTAQAEQDAAIIAAETLKIQSQAEKDANDLKTTSLTESVLREQWISKWNGVVPTYFGGSNSSLIFDMGVTE